MTPHRLVIVIETDAEAFNINPNGEIVSILERLTLDWQQRGVSPTLLKTRYGETCGRVDLRPKLSDAQRAAKRLRRLREPHR